MQINFKTPLLNNNKVLFIFFAFVFIIYILFGLFCLDIPYVKSDELWEISRAHFLLKYHHQGDPMFPKEISPYMSSLFSATFGNKYFGIIKTGSQAFFINFIPIDDVFAFRLTSFAWSLLVCFLTYKLAIKIGLNKIMALLSITLLIIAPEFFTQLHTQRPEMMITAAYLGGLLLFIRTVETKQKWKKLILVFLSVLYSWFSVYTLHPNAIMIPGTFAFIYFLSEYRKIFSLHTIILVSGMLAGAYYFNHLMTAPANQSIITGGGNLLEAQGRLPVSRLGFKLLYSMPVIFYNKFSAYNFFSKPLSLLFFVISCLSFYFLFKKNKTAPVYQNFDIMGLGLIVPLIILLFISGSNGHYNLICFPLCSILMAAAIYEFIIKDKSKKKQLNIIIGAFFIMFLSGFTGIRKQSEYTKEYLHLVSEIKKIIPDSKSTIIGNGLYYDAFKNQSYYSNSGMSPDIGKPAQSFEDAVRSVQANYLIIDDILVYRILRSRGPIWTDSMFVFINRNCELIKEINTNYYIGKTAEPLSFPLQWRYEGQKKNFLKKIKIYKINY